MLSLNSMGCIVYHKHLSFSSKKYNVISAQSMRHLLPLFMQHRKAGNGPGGDARIDGYTIKNVISYLAIYLLVY